MKHRSLLSGLGMMLLSGCATVGGSGGSPEPLYNVEGVWDGRFIPRDELLEAWSGCTDGAGQGVHLEECHGSPEQIARELAKYVGKDLGWGKGFSNSPLHLAEFLVCMWSFKAFRTYGTARNVPDDDEEHELVCPACKAPDPEYVGHCPLHYVEQFHKECRAKSNWFGECARPGSRRASEMRPET